MNTQLILTILLCVACSAFAQKYSAPFGEVPDAEMREALEIQDYAPNPGVEALVLYRALHISMDNAGTKYTYISRVKIFNSTGVNNWSDDKVTIKSGGLGKVRGYSYNLVDGQVIKRALDESDIHKEYLNRTWDRYVLTMPNVRKGAVIEYSVDMYLSGWWLPDFNFQLGVPGLYSEMLLENNRWVGFQAEVSGLLDVKYEELRKNYKYRWSAANIPAFNSEPYMPNDDLLISKLYLWENEQDWEDNRDMISWKKWFFALPGGQVSTIREKVVETTKDIAEPRAKVKAIVDYIKQNVSWNEVQDFYAYDFNDVLKRKENTGTAGDVNLLLTAMLSRAGIQSSPVLISTRAHGHHHEAQYALGQFNYVIAQAIIDKDTLYLDATEKNLQYDALPFRCLNDRGLMVTLKSTKWIDIKPKHKLKLVAEGNFTLDESGALTGKLSYTRDGYEAHKARDEFEKHQEAYYNKQLSEKWQVEKKSIQNEKSSNLPLFETYELVIPDATNVADPRIYINSSIFPYMATNPFKAEQRVFPIDFIVPIEVTLLCNITLPDGYVVEELPQGKVMATPGNNLRAVFNISGTEKQVQIMSRLQINQTYFSASAYQGVQEFFAKLIAKQGEQIVIKKRS